MKQVKALFILKRREDYSTDIKNFNDYTVSTGMYNSAKFVSDMLNDNAIESKVIVVNDNNDIDREVTAFRPSHVFIEGFWVIPEKFDVLIPLHKNVKWIVRCHSEMPFLAQEGVALGWTFGYLKRGVSVSGNSPRINREIRIIAASGLGIKHEQLEKQIPLLTNYYPVKDDVLRPKFHPIDGVINVGCFGAIRPMKNHLNQAIAAIDYADRRGLKLRFHINTGRVEMNGNNALKNLKSLFDNLPKHELVEHAWASHVEFLKTIKSMDICLQVSFTETFNIVTADAVVQGVPIVVSDEITWAHRPFADPVSTDNITEIMEIVLANRHHLIEKNRDGLREYSRRSVKRWVNYLNGEHSGGFQALLLKLENFFENL